MESFQNTVRSRIDFSDIGLHSGKEIKCSILPAEAGTGIVFRRIDIEDQQKNTIAANYKNVVSTSLSTNISNDFQVSVLTVEHLMSALWGCKIDNCIIELNGGEVPVMDGSAEPFVFLIECAGIKAQDKARNVIKVLQALEVYEREGDIDSPFIKIEPSDTFSVDIEIDFNNEFISKQRKNFIHKLMSFKSDISRARTFALEKDLEFIFSKGLAKGGSLSNTVVASEKGIVNKEGLRYRDEFVRHKILDCIGDIYLSGYYIKGSVKGFKSGHSLNNKLLKLLFSRNDYWEKL